MAIPQTQRELLTAIRTTYSRLVADLACVPIERVHEKTLEGHAKETVMSVANLVAYLVGWNTLVLKWCDNDIRGEVINFPEKGCKWNELGRLAQKFYADYENVPFSALLEKLEDVNAKIVSLVETGSDESLYGNAWYRTYTKGRMIQFNTSSPYANARTRLRKWLRAQAI